MLTACFPPLGPESPDGSGSDGDPNQPPLVSLIGPSEVFLGDAVEITLEVTDPDGDEFSFEFSFTEVPRSSALDELAVEEFIATFVPDAEGVFVVSVEVSDGTDTSVSEFTVTVISGAPGVPSTPTPADEGTGISISAGLDWADVSRATSYDVYIGVDSLPGTPVATVSESEYAPDLEYSTTYEWMVVASNSYGQTAGPQWSFTTQDEPLSPPAAPFGPTPADDALNLSRDVDLDWADATDAASYTLRYRPVGGGWTTEAGIGVSSFALPRLSWDTTYEWEVTSVNAAGSTTGPTWTFTTIVQQPGSFSLVSPSDAAVDQDVEIQLDWTDATRADDYDVYFGTAADPPFAASTSESILSRTGLSPGTTYYWRVVANNVGGSRSIGPFSFTTVPDPPSVPSGPSPLTGSNGRSRDTVLSWDPSARATSYEVYFGTNEVPETLVASVGGTSYDPGTLEYSQTYFWQIVAVNSGGESAGPIWNFTVQLEPPGSFSLSSPGDGETGVGTRSIPLDWTNASRADEYDVYFGSGSLPASPVATVTDSDYTLGILDRGTTYYWQIVAKNAGGERASGVRSFRTSLNSPAQPSDPSPADTADDALPDLTLDWADSQYATSYDLFYRTSARGPWIELASGLSESEYTAQSGDFDYGLWYQWYVVARNEEYSTDGPAWSFRLQSLDLTDELAGHWTFDGTLNDASGLDHHGYWNVDGSEPTYVDDRAGNPRGAISFTGELRESVVVPLQDNPTSILNNHTSGFSLSVWLRDTGENTAERFVSKRFPSGLAYEMDYHDTSGIRITRHGSVSTTVGQDSLTDGWNHLVISWDFEDSLLRVWANGVLVRTRSQEPFENSTDDLWIGAGGNYWFTGELDELRIYNRAISDVEAAALFAE